MSVVTDPGMSCSAQLIGIMLLTTCAVPVSLEAKQGQDLHATLQQRRSHGKQRNRWFAVRPLCH